jgi:hypothetical protein
MEVNVNDRPNNHAKHIKYTLRKMQSFHIKLKLLAEWLLAYQTASENPFNFYYRSKI